MTVRRPLGVAVARTSLMSVGRTHAQTPQAGTAGSADRAMVDRVTTSWPESANCPR